MNACPAPRNIVVIDVTGPFGVDSIVLPYTCNHVV